MRDDTGVKDDDREWKANVQLRQWECNPHGWWFIRRADNAIIAMLSCRTNCTRGNSAFGLGGSAPYLLPPGPPGESQVRTVCHTSTGWHTGGIQIRSLNHLTSLFFKAKKQWFYSKSFHPSNWTLFSYLYMQSHSFGHRPKFITLGYG